MAYHTVSYVTYIAFTAKTQSDFPGQIFMTKMSIASRLFVNRSFQIQCGNNPLRAEIIPAHQLLYTVYRHRRLKRLIIANGVRQMTINFLSFSLF